jgi:ATP-dependent DNA helicase RecG
MGTGINKMRKMIKEAGLPPIQFEFTNFFTIAFHRPQRPQKRSRERDELNFGVKGKQLDRLKRIIAMIYLKEDFKIEETAKIFGVTRRTIENDLILLKSKGVIKFIGPPKIGHYELTEKGTALFAAS